MQTVLFRMTLPRDCDLGPALRQVAERVAQCAGYVASDATTIGTSVGQAADTVLEGLAQGTQLDITFERDADHLHVWLRYPVAAAALPPAGVDAALSPDALRQGMDSVEFGREDDVAYCCLRRALPHEKTDHKCEMQPENH